MNYDPWLVRFNTIEDLPSIYFILLVIITLHQTLCTLTDYDLHLAGCPAKLTVSVPLIERSTGIWTLCLNVRLLKC